jgi:hypothetical protein
LNIEKEKIMKNHKLIDCCFFDKDVNLEKFNAILLKDLENKDIRVIQLNKNNLDEKKLNLLFNNLGISSYKFRKGVGYKGAIVRLQFKEIENNGVIFYRMKKQGKRFVADKENLLTIPLEELKYIYPLILSPEIKENKIEWQHNYIIYPYKYGERSPIKEEILKNETPTLYKYLKTHKIELLNQSSYNKRIQNNKEFYSLIRVGEYTYSNTYLLMRDNTKAVFQVLNKIKTDWGDEKIPIFDNHISYLSRIENREITKEEAEQIKEILSWKETKTIIEGMFDSRSISSRIPIKIERILDELSKTNK